MALNDIDTIVFDLGGVLIDWNPVYLYRKLITDEKKMQHFFDNVCTSDWNEAQDAGRPLKEATQLLLQQFPEHSELIEAYYGRWEEMLGGPIAGTVDILNNIRQSRKYRLYALTNWSHETFGIALQKYDFLHWFEGIVVSGEEKTRKPFPEFYNILLSRYNIIPEKALFIDDNKRNIEGANALKIRTIHFQSPGQLKKSLLDFDIVV